MSESGYQAIDLDDPGKVAEPDDLEIVHEEVEAPEVEEEAAPAPAPTPKPEAAEEEDEDEAASEGGKRRLTRSQRLKSARDAWQQRAQEAERRAQEAEAKAAKYEADAAEGAAVGVDLYIQTLKDRRTSLKGEYDAAFDAGDRDKIWEIQQRMADLAADEKLAERERRSLPPRRAPSGGEAQPQTPQTTARENSPSPTAGSEPKPSPEAMSWYEGNKDWFNKDAVMTQVARVVDQQMVAEGFSPEDPDYFDELDKRLRTELPHKFRGRPGPTGRQQAETPTIQARGGNTMAGNKIRVIITQADREMANHLGLDITTYAREKAKRERAQGTPNQYTEIL